MMGFSGGKQYGFIFFFLGFGLNFPYVPLNICIHSRREGS